MGAGVVLAWPFASHGAAMAGRAEWMPTITALTAATLMVLALVGSIGVRSRALLGLALAATFATWYTAPLALLYLAPAAINLAFAFYFASTLAPGREPRIAVYARRELGGDLPPDLARYTRGLTLAWSVLFVTTAAGGLLLAAFAPVTVWSAFTNVVSYLAVGALFVGEYLWRRVRFSQHRHASFLAHLRNVMQDRPWTPR